MQWIRESSPRWDSTKAALIGQAPKGTFEARQMEHGPDELLSGDWWRVEQDGRVIGYGWMDQVWGDAEILLVVHPEHRKQGTGAFILGQLRQEARSRGMNYLYNQIPEGHPDSAALSGWLQRYGFRPSEDGRVLRL